MNQATEHGIDAADGGGHITTQNDSPRWRRAPDLEVLGPAQDSGLRDATYLVRRWDDQMLQLTELLHLVLIHVEPSRSPEEIAGLVSAADGRTLTPAGLEYLIEQRLAPLGLVEQVGGGADEAGDLLGRWDGSTWMRTRCSSVSWSISSCRRRTSTRVLCGTEHLEVRGSPPPR